MDVSWINLVDVSLAINKTTMTCPVTIYNMYTYDKWILYVMCALALHTEKEKRNIIHIGWKQSMMCNGILWERALWCNESELVVYFTFTERIWFKKKLLYYFTEENRHMRREENITIT